MSFDPRREGVRKFQDVSRISKLYTVTGRYLLWLRVGRFNAKNSNVRVYYSEQSMSLSNFTDGDVWPITWISKMLEQCTQIQTYWSLWYERMDQHDAWKMQRDQTFKWIDVSFSTIFNNNRKIHTNPPIILERCRASQTYLSIIYKLKI